MLESAPVPAAPAPRRSPEALAPALLACLAAVSIAGACATSSGPSSARSDGPRTRHVAASVFRVARIDARPGRSRPASSPPTATRHARRESADPDVALVERVLHDAGLRFGTDGSTRALWGYLRTAHDVVPAAEARPGDVVLFDVWGTAPEPSCADHAGIVEAVDPDGRIAFTERRAGRVQRSFVHPALPAARRDPQGRVLNTFLRPMRIDEPPGARHFAGEMICAVVRVARS